MTAIAASLAGKIAYHSITGSGPWHPPSSEILHKPRITNRKPPELAGRHPVPRKVDLDLIQELHLCRLT
jgi:hypothetical protein